MPFDPFGDAGQEGIGYLRNFAGRKTASGVKRFEHEQHSKYVLTAIKNLQSYDLIDYNSVLDTHGVLFGMVYPWAGQDRLALSPQLKNGGYVRKGSVVFAEPDLIRRFAGRALEIASDPAKLADCTGRVFSLLAHAHPFLDGNGRTIHRIHGELVRRAAISIDWTQIPHERFLAALTEDLHEPNRGFLDRLIAPFIHPNPARDIIPEHLPLMRPPAPQARNLEIPDPAIKSKP